jgi:hypothetical protein
VREVLPNSGERAMTSIKPWQWLPRERVHATRRRKLACRAEATLFEPLPDRLMRCRVYPLRPRAPVGPSHERTRSRPPHPPLLDRTARLTAAPQVRLSTFRWTCAVRAASRATSERQRTARVAF